MRDREAWRDWVQGHFGPIVLLVTIENSLALLVLASVVFSIVVIERRIFGRKVLTPFAILGVPIVVVMTSAALFAPAAGYIELRPQGAMLWAVLLLVFWAGGLVVLLCFMNYPCIWPRHQELCTAGEKLLWLVFLSAALSASIDVIAALERFRLLSVVILVNRTDRVLYSASALHTQLQALLQLALVLFIGEGLTSAEIAEKMFISKRTVDFHRSAVMKKRKLKSLPELIIYSVNYLGGRKV